jgi:hypothetical protein
LEDDPWRRSKYVSWLNYTPVFPVDNMRVIITSKVQNL